MNPDKYFPVLILTYLRPDHLLRVIEGLKCQQDLHLFPIRFFIDGLPLNAKDKEQKKQEKIIDMIQYFSSHHPNTIFYKSSYNKGVFKAVQWATEVVLESFEGFIYLEEDIVPKPGFLSYMNQSLNFYADKKDIYAINGYAFSEIKPMVHNHSYTAYRFCPWGFATWKHQWQGYPLNFKGIYFLLFSPFFWHRFFRDSWGWGYVFFVYSFVFFLRKKIQPWDVLFFAKHYKYKHKAIWLKESLVINIGLDGSGLHEGVDFIQEDIGLVGRRSTNSICFLEETEVNLSLNLKISRRLSPIFRKKALKSLKKILLKSKGKLN